MTLRSEVGEKPATSRSEQAFRIEVINDPPGLPEERQRELIESFIELSARTTGGADWRTYRPALDGWREYYNSPGARPQDFERLILIYDGDMFIHFTAVVRIEHASEPLLFIRSGFTHNDYHGTGLLKTAILTIFSPIWLQELTDSYPKTTIAIRTANPVVYEAARHLVEHLGSQSTAIEFSIFPEILPGGALAPVPQQIVDLAQRTVAIVSPGSTFLPELFVSKGYYKQFGPLYKESDFPCRNPATREFFERWVDHSNQDGILILVQMRKRGVADGLAAV